MTLLSILFDDDLVASINELECLRASRANHAGKHQEFCAAFKGYHQGMLDRSRDRTYALTDKAYEAIAESGGSLYRLGSILH